MQDWVDRHGFLFVLAVIVIVWLMVTLVISYIGGWASLAQEFRCPEDFVGRRYHGYSGYMRGLAHYRNCLTLGANHQGLYLAVLFLFRLAHPPLFIPWREISVTRKRLLFIPMVRFQLGRELSIPFWVHKSVANKLRDAAGTEWPKESNG
jgi:hypothetical protein